MVGGGKPAAREWGTKAGKCPASSVGDPYQAASGAQPALAGSHRAGGGASHSTALPCPHPRAPAGCPGRLSQLSPSAATGRSWRCSRVVGGGVRQRRAAGPGRTTLLPRWCWSCLPGGDENAACSPSDQQQQQCRLSSPPGSSPPRRCPPRSGTLGLRAPPPTSCCGAYPRRRHGNQPRSLSPHHHRRASCERSPQFPPGASVRERGQWSPPANNVVLSSRPQQTSVFKRQPRLLS